MSESARRKDPGSVWRDQPEEERMVKLEEILSRRTNQLHARTRSEIWGSIAAAALFVAVAIYRLAPQAGGLAGLGAAAGIAWIAVTVYWFRQRIWPEPSRPDAIAASGAAYYRAELERRRDHLRSVWLWNGPLAVAGVVLVSVLTGRRFLGADRLWSAAPLFALLCVWVGFGIWRRLRQARELQREIDEMEK